MKTLHHGLALLAALLVLPRCGGETASEDFEPYGEPIDTGEASVTRANLGGLWAFDEASGSTAVDSAGGDHNATLRGGPARVTGKYGRALQLDGVDDYVDVGDVFDIAAGQGFTVSAWIRTTNKTLSSGDSQRIISKQASGTSAYAIRLKADGRAGFVVRSGNSNGIEVLGSSDLTDGAWHLVTGVRNGGSAQLFIDGKLDASRSAPTGALASSALLRIGAFTDGSQLFKGVIDDARVYTRALSTQDVADLYVNDEDDVQEPQPVPQGKPRLIVTTDIGGDPDDIQSIVRLLSYANEFDIEGLIASAAGTPGELANAEIHPEIIRNAIAAYGDVRNNLLAHAGGFPTEATLLSKVKSGNPNRGTGAIGSGKDTEGSNWIISVVDAADSRPVNIALWGGQTDFAQALWKVKNTRGSSGLATFVKKIRVHDIADQDGLYSYIQSNFPGLWYILNQTSGSCASSFRGMFFHGDTSTVTLSWINNNVRNHGPLGNLYPNTNLWSCGNGINGVKEGDTPSWFYFLPHGLNDPSHPEWGGWGGRFTKSGSVWRDARDTAGGETSALATVFRWRPYFQAEFQARMDWQRSATRSSANHPPEANVDGLLLRTVKPGATVAIDASDSSDPDGDALTYKWSVYAEPSSYKGAVSFSGTSVGTFKAPSVSSRQTIHVVLAVTDDGSPALTSFQRIVVTVDPTAP